MADTYPQTGVVDSSDPAIGAVAINYGSDQTVAGRNRWILLSTAGTLKVDMPDGTTGVSLILAAGMWKISVTKIYQSGSSSAVGFLLY